MFSSVSGRPASLSDRRAGQFIKMLSRYYFKDEETKIKSPLVAIYFSLIKARLDKEKELEEERLIDEGKQLNKYRASILEGMLLSIETLEDLIDYEVSKLFLEEEENINGAKQGSERKNQSA